MDHHLRLRIAVSRHGPYALITIAGTIGHESEQTLADHLEDAFNLTTTAVILDLSQADLSDPNSVRILADALRRTALQTTNHTMSLIACGLPEPAHDTLALSGIDHALYVQPDVDSATAWLEHGTHRPQPSEPAP